MGARWGRRVASSLFHYPHPPFDRLQAEAGVLRIVNVRTHEIRELGPSLSGPIQVRYRRLPLEARSVVALPVAGGEEEILFAPMRLKATGWCLQDAGWEVTWRFRSASLRSGIARGARPLNVVLPLDRPRWRPLFGPRAPRGASEGGPVSK